MRWQNGLFLFAILGLSAPASGADEPEKKKKPEPKPVVAHIAIGGSLDEEGGGAGGLFGGGGGSHDTLPALLKKIHKAKLDPAVKALYLQIEEPSFGLFSFGKIEEVRRAIADFRAAGKPAFAYLESVGGLEYLIATACDTIAIPESGEFGLTGLHLEMQFYKDFFEKVKIKADFLTMGDAKGAADPYLRTEMSPANRKQYEMVMDDLYENGLIGAICKDRTAKKWKPEDVKKLIDTAPHLAKAALEAGLVDRLAYANEFEAEMLKKATDGKGEISRNYGKEKNADEGNPFAALMKLMQPAKKTASKKPKIAVIYAVGGITGGKSGGGLMGGSTMGSTTIIEAVEQAEKDDTVKAIVLRIDSGGGSALASDLMWNALRNCKKPVVASMGDVAASGGYYIAMGAKKVYAEPGTLTGSIGVLGGKLVLGETMNWVGLRTQTLNRGQNAGWSSSNSMFSESERTAITKTMAGIYDQFLDRTVQNRKAAGVAMTVDTLKPLAGGRIWTGRQAKERGLVDELGTLSDALADAKAMAKMDGKAEPELLILPEPSNFLDKLLEGGLGAKINVGGLAESVLGTHPKALEPFLANPREKVWLMAPLNGRVK